MNAMFLEPAAKFASIGTGASNANAWKITPKTHMTQQSAGKFNSPPQDTIEKCRQSIQHFRWWW